MTGMSSSAAAADAVQSTTVSVCVLTRTTVIEAGSDFPLEETAVTVTTNVP